MFGFLKRRKVDPEAELRRVLGDYQLPAFRGTVLRILDELRSPDASSSSVAAVVSVDPGVSTGLLKLVNSAAFGSARSVDTVAQAVTMLGNSAVESLVLSFGVASALPAAPTPSFDSRRFWAAAARRATTGQALAGIVQPATRALSFTASLLSDMAVPLLANNRGDRYGALLEAWRHGDGALFALEMSEYGWTHADVASWLCASWRLPEPLSEAIAGHHPRDETLSCPVAVQLAAFLGEDRGQGVDELIAEARSRCGLSEEQVVEVLDEASDRAEGVAALFV